MDYMAEQMIFRMPRFEIKNISGTDWEKVSEKEFLLKLSDEFNLITPVLNDIFQGKEIINRDFIYRIRP
jgi:hypothetical protein